MAKEVKKGDWVRWKHNKVFIHANIGKRERCFRFYVFVFEWGALDSNTISSVICWSCQWLFGENCGNLFHYFAFPSILLSLLHIHEKCQRALTRKFINKSSREFIIVWYMCFYCEIFTASLSVFASVLAQSVLSLSWNSLSEF